LKRWCPNDTPPGERNDILSHHEVLERIGGYEQEPRGVKIVGHRGYFLTGPGVRLNFALVQYGLDFLSKREYTPIQTPFFMNKDVMAKTAQLDDFDDQLYKVNFPKVSRRINFRSWTAQTRNILLLLLNNLSLRSIWTTGSVLPNSPSDMPATVLASVVKLAHMGKTHGASSESINSKRCPTSNILSFWFLNKFRSNNSC
jgi:seryl-tRNA synthetase